MPNRNLNRQIEISYPRLVTLIGADPTLPSLPGNAYVRNIHVDTVRRVLVVEVASAGGDPTIAFPQPPPTLATVCRVGAETPGVFRVDTLSVAAEEEELTWRQRPPLA